jgi:curved DNA-binding protein CbpA
MAIDRDYYKVLGIAPVSSQEDVRKAYRMLSKKFHPDLNPQLKTMAEDRMKELVSAYNILNNPVKRKEYDRQSHFAVRHFKKSRKKSDEEMLKKPSRRDMFKKEPSLLERILSPFLKREEVDVQESAVDFKQADVHFTLGLSMAEQEGFYESAKGEFKMALRFDPDFVEAHFNLALMCYKLGQFEEARVGYQKVLQQDKEDAVARKMISLLRDDL